MPKFEGHVLGKECHTSDNESHETDMQLTTRDWVYPLFQNLRNEQACMSRSS